MKFHSNKRRATSAQGIFDFDAVPVAVPVAVPDPTQSPPPRVEPPKSDTGRKLDAESHRHYARLAGAKQTEMIAKASEWPEHAKDLAEIAKMWKEFAEKHQNAAFVMEPETRHL